MEIIALTCPSCGAKLQITEDIERFACAHCGNEHIVQRSGGTIALKKVVERLNKLSTSVDRASAELALRRIKDEVQEVEGAYKAACKERDNIQELFIVSLICAFIGCFLFASGLFQSTLLTVLGVIALVICCPFCYFGYVAIGGWNRRCDRLSQESKQKNEQLRKHKELVDDLS